MYEDRHQLWGFNHRGRLMQRSLPARRAQVGGSRPLPFCWPMHCTVPQLMSTTHPPSLPFVMQGTAVARCLTAQNCCIWSHSCWLLLQELGSLTGLRYYYSTALEACDFLAPLLERLFSRIGDAVSWLLVRLIGRSLGLIYRGVKESLMPRQQPPVPRRGNQPRWSPL